MGMNFYFHGVFNWVLSNSLKSSLLVALIIILKLIFKEKIGAKLHYGLWLVVLLRLLMPWAPGSSISIYNLFQLHNSVTFSPVSIPTSSEFTGSNGIGISNPNLSNNSNNSLITDINAPSDRNEQASFPVTSDKVIFYIWLAGVVFLGLYTVHVNYGFTKKISKEINLDENQNLAFSQIKEQLGISKDIPLIETSIVVSPSLFGIIRPRLLLPEKINDKLSLEQLNYIFTHELLHYKHKDIIVRWLMNILAILHWFNPIIWYAFYKMQEDQEMVCDAMALSRIGFERSKDYGHTIIALLEGYPSKPNLPSLTSLSSSSLQIARRLKMINRFKKVSFKWSLLGFVSIILVALITLTNAKASVETPSTLTKPNSSQLNKVIDVNSLETVSLDNQLVEDGRQREGSYTFSSVNDIASIAYGFKLSALDMGDSYINTQKQKITESLPTSPIFVKSYDHRYPDYYLVPFVRDQKFVDQAIWGDELRGKTGTKISNLFGFDDTTQHSDWVFPREKLLNINITDAINIIKETRGEAEVPVPRLVYRESEISKSPYQPFWEFTFEDNAHLYVNQEGKVFDSNIIPWYQTYVALKYNPEAVQIQDNKLIREDFTVTLANATRLQHYQTKELNGMEVGFSIENNAGIDQKFIPSGKIVGIIGKSGKLYRNDYVSSLDQISLDLIRGQESQAERGLKLLFPYQPGVFKLGFHFSVDPTDSEISKFVYLDNNNQEIEVPVSGIDYQVREVGNGK